MKNQNSGTDVLIRLEDLCKSFDNEPILKKINLNIRDKEFVTLLGPSGCGKTTILRCIAGFENPDSGTVFFDGKNINDVPPYQRPVNTVFQKYALFPHLNVFDNVAFGLRIKKVPEAEIKQKVKKMLAMVDLKGYEKRTISKLSGGQQQRVAIARALVNMPRLLLLDEPLGALDLKLRKDMQFELKNIHKQANTTFLYVTHDQEEALTMSDTIVVMKSGTIQQIGSPQDVYNEPANAFVADFIGEANIFDASMINDYEVILSGASFPCVDKKPNELVDVVIRPEDVEIVEKDKGIINGLVEASLFKGVHYEMTVSACGETWLIHSTQTATVGETIGMNVKPENIHVMNRMFPGILNVIETKALSDSAEENGVYLTEIEIDSVKYGIKTKRKYSEAENITVSVNPYDIALCSDDEGDFSGTLDSVVWKASHYEMILISDNRRWLIKSEADEQVGSYIGIKLNAENITEYEGE